MIGSGDQPHHHAVHCGLPSTCCLAAATKRKIPLAVLGAVNQLCHSCVVEPLLSHSRLLVHHPCVHFQAHFNSLALMEPMDGVPARASPVVMHLVSVAVHSTADEKPSPFLAILFVLGNFKEMRLLQSTEVDFLIGLIGLLKAIHHRCVVTMLLPDGINNLPLLGVRPTFPLGAV